MRKPRAIVISGYGINCENETNYALKLAGADSKIVHLSKLLYGEEKLEEYEIMFIPGGFSGGDDLGAGRYFANKLKYKLGEEFLKFIKVGKLIGDICNGFQIIVKLGVLPGFDLDFRTQNATLTFNDSGRFEDRWVYLKVNPKSPCIFTRGIDVLYLPVRHGEGKFIASKKVLKKLWAKNQVVLQYVNEKLELAGYPYNPNGSIDNIAGICSPNGRIFGLMPHPEAFIHFTNHPRWTRIKAELKRKNLPLPEEGDGLRIFKNAVDFAREHLI
ncbi:MAG: phosphoribosylformylglycinamidine synthase I [Methanocellales archaeon]